MALHNSDGNHSFRDFARGFQTKNLVKGMNGGTRGVDFQDDNAEAIERFERAAAERSSSARAGAVTAVADVGGGDSFDNVDAAPDFSLVVPDVGAQEKSEDTRRRRLEAERIKKKIKRAWDDQDEEADPDEDEEDDEDAAPEDVPDDAPDSPFATRVIDRALRRAQADVIEQLLQDPSVELRVYGTLRLQQPEEMRRALGTPLRVARHLNVLARRLLTLDGARRPTVVAYLASCMRALGPGFGQSVLSSFSAGVGIGEVYPLEVIDSLLLMDPHFVPNLSRGAFLTSSPRVELFEGVAGLVQAPPDMKVTAFALKGGGNVGYEFFPATEPGAFHLLLDTAGRYRLLLRGVHADKRELLQEIRVNVRPERRATSRDVPVPAEAPAPAAPDRYARPRTPPIPNHLTKLLKPD